jgi:ribonuclease P protein component
LSAVGAAGAPARLRARAEFRRAAKGRRRQGGAFDLQMAETGAPEAPARFGLTITRKVGNAVVRNRIRRRLREALRLTPDLPARRGSDYVIVARRTALRTPFEALKRDLAAMIGTIHEPRRKPR